MFGSARKWILLATLTVLVPVTIVCDISDLEYLLDTYEFDVYYDEYDYHDYHDCWSDCDEEWSFDFDWWWW